MVVYKPHKLEIVGSSPTHVTNFNNNLIYFINYFFFDEKDNFYVCSNDCYDICSLRKQDC